MNIQFEFDLIEINSRIELLHTLSESIEDQYFKDQIIKIADDIQKSAFSIQKQLSDSTGESTLQ